jgi:protein translocase SecG subunit
MFFVNVVTQFIIDALPYIQIALSILLGTGVLLQHSDASLGGAFGGSDNWSSTFHTRRGFEKILFNGTIVIAILFTFSSILAITL